MRKKKKISLDRLTGEDLGFVKEVYDYYAENSTTVYFTGNVSVETIKSFIPVGDPLYRSFIIRDEEGEKAGFCYFSRFKPREAYDVSVEVTLYLLPRFAGRGYGYQAMKLMEPMIRESGFINIMALIDSENAASIRLFERCGYGQCGHIRQVARKFGKDLDLLMFQKLLQPL